MSTASFRPASRLCGLSFLGLLVLLTCQASSAASETVEESPPVGNLAEVMRALHYPTSNLLFEVQSSDPGGEPPEEEGATPLAMWTGLYRGWQAVEQAAITIIETESLTLRPRLCENGREAPVEQDDYREWTREMTAAGRAILDAARKRDRDDVIELTNRLVGACEDCHYVYMAFEDRCNPDAE